MHTPALAEIPPEIEYTGTLLRDAEARCRVDAQDQTVPVLCLDITLDNALRTLMHVEQPFPLGTFEQAQAAARRLKKGQHVAVQAPLESMRLISPRTTHIHTHPATPGEPIDPHQPDTRSAIACPPSP